MFERGLTYHQLMNDLEFLQELRRSINWHNDQVRNIDYGRIMFPHETISRLDMVIDHMESGESTYPPSLHDQRELGAK